MFIKFIAIIFIIEVSFALSKKFPIIDERINLSEVGQIKSINIKSYEEYNNYITNKNYIFSLFHVSWCGHCKKLKPIIDKASSYNVLNKVWLFLKIDCTTYSYICSILNIQMYPTIKIYKNKKILYKEPPRELEPLLQFLLKISDNPIIRVNSKTNFLEKYGDNSPLIEYTDNNNSQNNSIIECIEQLGNNEFIEDFYFGIYESKNNKDKIIFNYNDINLPDLVYEYDGNCTNAFSFLYENKYSLINEINSNFLKEISWDLKIIIFVVTFMKNKKINDFVFSDMKNISYYNKKYIFGYADYNKDKYISKFFNFNLNNSSEMKLIMYDFKRGMYYIHDKLFNIDIDNKKEIINQIQNLINKMNSLKFSTGSKFKDFFSFIKFEEMSPQKQMIVMGIFVLILICVIYVLFSLSGSGENSYNEDEFDEFIEQIEEVKSSKKGEEIVNEKNNKKNDLDKPKVE